jgi:hypothetical protein
MGNAQQFSVELKAESTKLAYQIDRFQRQLTMSAFRRILERTPVDTGRARASWNISRGTPDESIPPEGYYGPAAAFGKVGALTPSPQRLDDIHISTNLDYVADLETGTSKQAPQGMLAITVAELKLLKLHV